MRTGRGYFIGKPQPGQVTGGHVASGRRGRGSATFALSRGLEENSEYYVKTFVPRIKGMASTEIYKETGRIDLNNDFIFI